MDDLASVGDYLAEGVDVGHHVMAQAFLVLGGADKIDVVEMGAHLGELFGADARRDAIIGGEAEFGLSLGEDEPEAAPGRELAPRRPEPGHLGAGIAADKWVVAK